jgi:hypothetical protein
MQQMHSVGCRSDDDEEIDNINYTSAHMLAREVLAKLKEKNGYAEEKNNAA